MQDLYNTDPTQETCPRSSCRLHTARTREHEVDHTDQNTINICPERSRSSSGIYDIVYIYIYNIYTEYIYIPGMQEDRLKRSRVQHIIKYLVPWYHLCHPTICSMSLNVTHKHYLVPGISLRVLIVPSYMLRACRVLLSLGVRSAFRAIHFGRIRYVPRFLYFILDNNPFVR